MNLEMVPLLRIQRDLYDLPKGRERFERYLGVMTHGKGEMELPLSRFNPMGKSHVAKILDALLDLGAEAIAEATTEEAAHRLSDVDAATRDAAGGLRVGLVVVDDLAGGWTDRYFMETDHAFDSRGEVKRRWATALLWSSEAPTPAAVRCEVLSSIFRTLYLRRWGRPGTLSEMMNQAGSTAAFAGLTPGLDAAVLERVRSVIERYRGSDHFPTIFACLWGDEIAKARGYEALGLPVRAGLDLALADALASTLDPVAALSAGPGPSRAQQPAP